MTAAALPSQDDMKNLAHRIWAPAVAGAVGAGGLSGYLSSKSTDNPDETSSQRRARILRNALAGTAMGGIAGAATEEGARALYKPFFGDTDQKPALIDRAIGSGAKGIVGHAGALGTAALGGAWIGRNRKAHENAASENILSSLGGKINLRADNQEVPISNAKELRSHLDANPSNVEHLEGKLLGARRKAVSNPDIDKFFARGEHAEGMGGRHHARDLINEAGFKNQTDPTKLQLLKQILLGKREKSDLSEAEEYENATMSNFLRSQGVLSKQVAKLVGKEPIPSGIGEHAVDVGRIPELYRRLIRPSIRGRPIRPIPLPLQIAGLAGGAYAANRVQKRLMGQ